MGSNSRGKDGEGTSGVNKLEVEENYEYDEQEIKFLPPELLLHHNVNINRFTDPHPLVTHQVPVVTMQRPGVVAQPQQHAFLQNGYVESVVHERLKRVTIRWKHSGTNVAIAGSWDNWKTMEPLQNVDKKKFVIVKTLPIGIYHYRFIVDGYLRHAREFPSDFDDSGHPYNILDLQDYVPETQLSDFEDPPSPPSSYDNKFLNDNEFSKPPPEIPPQLPVTIRHEPPPASNALLSLAHLELNHLYIHRIDGEQFVALRSTHRFQHKYVKTIVYKSLRRER